MKWNNIVTKGTCFEKDLWERIIDIVGKMEDTYDEQITISEVVNELCRYSIDKISMEELFRKIGSGNE